MYHVWKGHTYIPLLGQTNLHGSFVQSILFILRARKSSSNLKLFLISLLKIHSFLVFMVDVLFLPSRNHAWPFKSKVSKPWAKPLKHLQILPKNIQHSKNMLKNHGKKQLNPVVSTSLRPLGLERTGLFGIEAGMEGVEFQFFETCRRCANCTERCIPTKQCRICRIHSMI